MSKELCAIKIHRDTWYTNLYHNLFYNVRSLKKHMTPLLDHYIVSKKKKNPTQAFEYFVLVILLWVKTDKKVAIDHINHCILPFFVHLI